MLLARSCRSGMSAQLSLTRAKQTWSKPAKIDSNDPKLTSGPPPNYLVLSSSNAYRGVLQWFGPGFGGPMRRRDIIDGSWDCPTTDENDPHRVRDPCGPHRRRSRGQSLASRRERNGIVEPVARSERQGTGGIEGGRAGRHAVWRILYAHGTFPR